MESFVDMVVRYGSLISDGDPIFMKFGACQILGNIAGHKSYIDITPDRERLNLYTLFIAESFYGRKNVAQDIIKSCIPSDKILPNETSGEKFISSLVERPDGFWFAGEFSKILKHINKGHYLGDIAETMNDVYNYKYEVYKRTTMKDEYVIINPYPFFNSTLTPEVLMDNVSIELMDGGFFGRLILVRGKAATGDVGRKPMPPEALELKDKITALIDALYKEKGGYEFAFKFDTKALKKINEIETKLGTDKNIRAISGRYGQAIIKLSALLTLSDYIGKMMDDANKVPSINSNNINNNNNNNNINNSNSKDLIDKDTIVDDTYLRYYDYFTTSMPITNITTLTIFTIDVEKAYEMIKPCIDFAQILFDNASMNRKFIVKVRSYITNNNPVLKSDVMRYCNLDSSEIKVAEDTLYEQDVIKIIKFRKMKSNNVQSKIQTVYCLRDTDKSVCSVCEFKNECTEKVGGR
jgi:hypothetical protein